MNGKIKRYLIKFLKNPSYGFRVFLKRLGSLFSYYAGKGSSVLPETVSLFLTYRCNLSCQMCAYWGKCGTMKNEPKGYEMPMFEMQQLIDELSSFKPNITLFGGEPFIYQDWPLLVSYIKQKGLRVNCVTNATLLRGREEELVLSGLDELIFSLEGPPEIHDKVVGLPGAFEKAFQAVKEINRIKVAKNSKNPQISIAVTINEDNFSSLLQIVETAFKLSPQTITFHHLAFLSKSCVAATDEILSKSFGTAIRDFKGFIRNDPPAINIEELLSQIERIKKNDKKNKVFFYPDLNADQIRGYYQSIDYKCADQRRCLSAWMTAYVFPDGSVGPCEELNLNFGNVRKEPFKKIWNNKEFRRFRRLLKQKRHFSVCPRCTELYRF